jgi:hypothetical protein
VRDVVDARNLDADENRARHGRFSFHDRGGNTNQCDGLLLTSLEQAPDDPAAARSEVMRIRPSQFSAAASPSSIAVDRGTAWEPMLLHRLRGEIGGLLPALSLFA